MKALFLGHFAATVAPRILAKVKTPLETSILGDEGDAEHLAPLLAEAEIVVGHIWRPSFPPAPRIRLLQSVAAGLDLLDTEAVPKGVTVSWHSLAPGAVAMPVLVEVTPHGDGRRFALAQPENWLGRDAACAVPLPDDALLAKRHNVSNIKNWGSINKHLWPLTKRHRWELRMQGLAVEISAYFQPPSECGELLSVTLQCAER